MNRKIHTKFASTAAVLLGTALLLSGCGDSTESGQEPAASSPDNGGGYAAPSPTASDTATAAADLKTAETNLGTIVVDGQGMSLYYFTKDTKGTSTSACTDACLDAWPIAVAAGDTPVLEGVTGEAGTIDSPDGAKQLTLNGMPLYYFAQDTKPGDVTGQGVNDVWYVVTPAGEMIK